MKNSRAHSAQSSGNSSSEAPLKHSTTSARSWPGEQSCLVRTWEEFCWAAVMALNWPKAERTACLAMGSSQRAAPQLI
eukprot:12027093-Heterocapsa_arctica.AAC.1